VALVDRADQLAHWELQVIAGLVWHQSQVDSQAHQIAVDPQAPVDGVVKLAQVALVDYQAPVVSAAHPV
jgi:hypothetical protein